MRLFLDMDGVLANFEAGFERLFNEPIREFKARHESEAHSDEVMWPRIYGEPDFFRNLPMCEGATAFLLWVSWHPTLPQPYILTACPRSHYQSAALQKRDWVRKHCGAQYHTLPVLGGRNKALFMHSPGDVLIDDHRPNIEAWREAGGIGILHRSWDRTKAELLSLLDTERNHGLGLVTS